MFTTIKFNYIKNLLSLSSFTKFSPICTSFQTTKYNHLLYSTTKATPAKVQKQIENLRKQIAEYNDSYYNQSVSLITDQEYDKLFQNLAQLEAKHPETVSQESPTQKVGADLKNTSVKVHAVPMLSLMNTYNTKDVEKFGVRVTKDIDASALEYVAELKYDGVAISLTYENGNLTQAVTRGDGKVGQDITSNTKKFAKNIPFETGTNDNFEVRGEIMISKTEFERLNLKAKEEDRKIYSNPRNLCSGILHRLDDDTKEQPNLEIIGYSLITDTKDSTQTQNLEKLKQYGFTVDKKYKTFKDLKGAMEFVEEWRSQRHDYEYGTDGVVIKINSEKQQRDLGSTARFPRWAIAFKYPAVSVKTKLLNITLQVGRTGKVTPVAEVQPVDISGSVVGRATLFNLNYITKLGIYEGCTVAIEKSAEIIPKITEVINPVKGKIWDFQKCPTDNSKFCCPCERKKPLSQIDSSIDHFCNFRECPEQVILNITHFASKTAMNIDSFAIETIKTLINEGLLKFWFFVKLFFESKKKDISDIYDLPSHTDYLTTLDGWGQKKVENLEKAIQDSKKEPFFKVLFAIGIRFVGAEYSKILTKNFNSIEKLQKAKLEDIESISGVGENVAKSVIQFFKSEENLEMIQRLKEAGLKFENDPEENEENEKKEETKQQILSGKSVLITGSFTKLGRNEIKDLVKTLGAKIAGSPSKNVNFALIGAKPGPAKLKQITSLNIKIVSEDEFFEKLKEQKINF